MPRTTAKTLPIVCLFAAIACSDDPAADNAADVATDAVADESASSDAADVSAETVLRPDELGLYSVGHRSFTATDDARGGRRLLVDVWYPVDVADAEGAEATKYPLAPLVDLDSEVAVDEAPISAAAPNVLVVFSHGYQAIHIQSIDLMEMLASHGFVVASPEHTGNAQSSATDSFDVAAANRVPDVSFIIDHMMGRAADPDDLFFGGIEAQPVGVAGHSFGGMTAIGMAAGWAGADPDPRVVAIAPVSAVIDGELQEDSREGDNIGFDEDALSGVTVPVLLLGGSEDVNVPIENNAIAFRQMTAAPVVYKVDVIGANHTHFANVCVFGDLLLELGVPQDVWPSLGAEALIEPYEATCSEDAFSIDEAIRLQNLYVTAFMKRHLLDDDGYGAFLDADYAEQEPAVTIEVRGDLDGPD